ncbi:hypothetical protein F5Y16DRAFT_9557 [Xylariaceae sp. FL0255]|nr:hypothetical protein F5Y16DRAFT_9557 [Xylariaceae sp. FL0255]
MAQDNSISSSPRGTSESTGQSKRPSEKYETFQPAPPSNDIQRKQQDKPSRPTFLEGIQSIRFDDFWKILQIPCAREGFLTGIGSGVAIGAVRYLVGGRATRAANWAAGSFIIGGIVHWEYCQAQRRRERATMARAVQVMEQKKAEQRAQALQAANAARIKREEEEKALQAQKKWYKFW